MPGRLTSVTYYDRNTAGAPPRRRPGNAPGIGLVHAQPINASPSAGAGLPRATPGMGGGAPSMGFHVWPGAFGNFGRSQRPPVNPTMWGYRNQSWVPPSLHGPRFTPPPFGTGAGPAGFHAQPSYPSFLGGLGGSPWASILAGLGRQFGGGAMMGGWYPWWGA